MENRYKGYEIIVKNSAQTRELAKLYDILCDNPGITPVEIREKYKMNERVYSRLRWLEKLGLIKLDFGKIKIELKHLVDVWEEIE